MIFPAVYFESCLRSKRALNPHKAIFRTTLQPIPVLGKISWLTNSLNHCHDASSDGFRELFPTLDDQGQIGEQTGHLVRAARRILRRLSENYHFSAEI